MQGKKRKEAIARLDLQSRARECDDGLWALVRSIRTAPGLRELVTLDSRPLHPLVTRRGKEARLHFPIAVPRSREGGRLAAPWAMVEWEWPSKRLIGFRRLAARRGAPDPVLDERHVFTAERAEVVERALARGEVVAAPSPLPELLASTICDPGAEGATTVEESDGLGGGSEVGPPPLTLEDALERLAQGRRLAQEVGASALVRECDRLHDRLYASHFVVAVAGERGRGKSRLINRLLDAQVLPERPSGRPALLHVVSGDEERWTTSRDRPRRAALDREALWDLLADEAGDEALLVRGTLDHPWLDRHSMALIEVPSPAALGTSGEAAVDALAAADAALFVVNATMALSATERRLLTENILARHVPRVAIVLTRLDTVAESDRREVVGYIRQKLENEQPGIELCLLEDIGMPEEPAGELICGPGAIRAKLEEWAGDPRAELVLRRQVTSSIELIEEKLRVFIERARDAAQLSETQRRERLAREKRALRVVAAGWDDLQLAHDQRRVECQEWLVATVDEHHRATATALQYELQRSRPDHWWHQELPYRLQAALERCEKDLQRKLGERIDRDLRQLVRDAEKAFARAIPLDATRPRWRSAGDHESRSELTLTNLEQRKLLIRVASLAAMPAGYFLLPLGPIAALTAGVILVGGEIWMREETKNQRALVSEALTAALNATFGRVTEEGRNEIANVYSKASAALREHQDAWLAQRIEALEQPTPTDASVELWSGRLRRLGELGTPSAA